MIAWIGVASPPYDEANVRLYIKYPSDWDGYQYQCQYLLMPKKFFRECGYEEVVDSLEPYKPELKEVEIIMYVNNTM